MTEASAELAFSSRTGRLCMGSAAFNPWALAWEPDEHPEDAEPIAPIDALRRLFREGRARRVPVAVIGPREANEEECATAATLGRAMAELGLCLICGGKSGVMEAVCKGHAEGGGLPIGLLPDEEWTAANDHVAIPIATGIGNARNAIIARCALALVAIGGGYGTLSEMAFGLHYGRLVIALGSAPEVPGAVRCATADAALDRIARRVFGLDALT